MQSRRVGTSDGGDVPDDADRFSDIPGGPPGRPQAVAPRATPIRLAERPNSMADAVLAMEERQRSPRLSPSSGGHGDYSVEMTAHRRSPHVAGGPLGGPPAMMQGPRAPVVEGPASVPTSSPGPRRGGEERAPSPTREQQVQPVLLTPVGARAFALLDEGGPQMGPPFRECPRRSMSTLRSMGSATKRRIDAHLRKGLCPFLLLCGSAAALFFIFLQE